MLMILLSILSAIRHLISGNNLNWLLNMNLIYETLRTGARSGLLISMLEKPKWFRLTGLMTLFVLMWKWMGAPNCYLELLDKLQKQICRTAGPSLAASLEPFAHRRNLANLSFFYTFYFGRCSSELAQLVPLPFCRGRSTRYSDRLHDFSVTIPRCYKDVYVNSFFLRIARLGILCL